MIRPSRPGTSVRARPSSGDDEQLLTAWQHTAEVRSDPELLAALTTDHGADHGQVPDPREVG
ncbi:hypothetical protein [Streptomyces candidus]|uniref:Uncharacterized protein n=1 Tax=Streptomyces candidus TaxID=67283 RepID=A0A7X0HD99_9ACTN|nr:hypothetical protein [Streptomyces candidus]MBB6435371.1 hypothetical protein [Streptomyces candidus]